MKTQIKGGSFPGSSVHDNWTYHDLPFGVPFKSHRHKTQKRVDQILAHYSVRGKQGLDLGCSVGGLTFRLQQAGANMLGVDYDQQSIDVANELEAEHQTGAAFLCIDILPHWVMGLTVDQDFVIFLDTWMWVAQAAGVDFAKNVLKIISHKVDMLFFSTSQGISMAKSHIKCAAHVQELLEETTDYKVEAIGTVIDGWYPRVMFKCSH